MAVLDFVVIGAPNAGAAALGRVLGDHAQVAFPISSRASVLVDTRRYVFGPEWFEPGFFAGEGTGALRGMVSPGHMSGLIGVASGSWPVEGVAAGMVKTLPEVKLIAHLRDPVERAIAHHRLTSARGLERRPLERALREQLSAGALSAARARPRMPTGYVAWGEYGRILGAYRLHYPRSQLLVLYSSELETDPAGTLARVASFLEISDEWPIETEPEPSAGDDDDRAPLSQDLRSRLRAHFADDAQDLEDCGAPRAPWSHDADPDQQYISPAVANPRGSTPEVSIVVLVHETPDEAELVLDSIVRHTEGSYEVLLVDNGSSNSVRDALAAMAETYGARLVRFEENLTFTVANNTAIEMSQGEDILLLNSDVIVTHNWLSNLRTALHSAPDVALVGPRTNNVSPPQGNVWPDDSSAAGVERFGRFFNHSDPRRWFEVSHVCGYAMLARRAAWEASGGLNKDFSWFGEDGELSDVLSRAGWRLLCAGDTFIYHSGHRSFWLSGFNRTAKRFGIEGAKATRGANGDAHLVTDSRGWVFEVHGGVASHVETHAVLRMIRANRAIVGVSEAELAAMPVGTPISPCRVRGTDEAWVLHSGWRRRVTGDKQRIRKLPELAVVEPDEIERLPRGPDLAVEDGLPEVPKIRSRLPSDAAAIVPGRLVGVELVAEEIGVALKQGRGFALIRLDVAETVLLNEGMWPVDGVRVDLARVGVREDPGAAAAAVRDAIVDADVVGVVESRDRFEGAPLLEQVLLHFDLYPRLRCSAQINYELLGVDPATGLFGARSRPLPVLQGRPLALVGLSGLVGSAMWRQRERLQGLGLEVRLAVALDDMGDVGDAFMELAAHREEYDVVLVAGDVPAKPLCVRLARELEVVALDIGHALDRTLHPRRAAPEQLKARKDVTEYLRRSALPATGPAHELEGKLVRVAGEAAVHYVERGAARALEHRELLALFDDPPVQIERQVLDSLPRGMPLFAVHERFGGTYLPINGTKRPIRIGLPFIVLDDPLPSDLPVDNRAIHWYPAAGLGGAGRGQR